METKSNLNDIIQKEIEQIQPHDKNKQYELIVLTNNKNLTYYQNEQLMGAYTRLFYYYGATVRNCPEKGHQYALFNANRIKKAMLEKEVDK